MFFCSKLKKERKSKDGTKKSKSKEKGCKEEKEDKEKDSNHIPASSSEIFPESLSKSDEECVNTTTSAPPESEYDNLCSS